MKNSIIHPRSILDFVSSQKAMILDPSDSGILSAISKTNKEMAKDKKGRVTLSCGEKCALKQFVKIIIIIKIFIIMAKYY